MSSNKHCLSPEIVIAHRGLQKLYPENSLLGINAAINAGANFVEVDVQLSKDQQAMIYHDESLQRVSAIDASIFDFYAKELWHKPAHEPHRFEQQFAANNIASLGQLQDILFAQYFVQVFVELKQQSISHFGIETCLTSIEEALGPAINQCILISYNEQAVKHAREFGFMKTGIVLSSWEHRDEQISNTHADYAFIDKLLLPDNELLSCSATLVIFEVADQQEATQLLQRGANMIESFDCATMLGG